MLPLSVISRREIAAKMDAARFLALQGRFDHEAGHGEQVLQFPRCPSVGCITLAAQALSRTIRCTGLLHAGGVSGDTHVPYHVAAGARLVMSATSSTCLRFRLKTAC